MNTHRLSCTLVLLLILIWPAASLALPVPSRPAIQAQEPQQVACLKAVYQDWKKHNGFGSDKRTELKKYFGCFPSDFKTYNSVAYFGYKQVGPYSGVAGALYDHGQGYFDLLRQTKEVVGETAYEEKLISLSMGATVEADAEYDDTAILEHFIEKELKRAPQSMLQKLSRRTPQEIKTFWRFMVTTDRAPKWQARFCRNSGSRDLLACKILGDLIRNRTLPPPPC